MSAGAKSVPRPEQPLSPYLSVPDAAAAIEFYREAFGATETLRLEGPEGEILHAEVEIAGAAVMLAGESPEWENWSPASLGGTPVRLHLYVEDVDALFRRAVAAGAKELIPVEDQFYGDRSGRLEDPFGHVWILATHREDMGGAEMERRAAEMLGS